MADADGAGDAAAEGASSAGVLASEFWARLVAGFALVSVIVGGVALVVSFGRGFDLSDEGLVLSLYQHGADGCFLSFVHVLIHPVGRLFGHGLFGYRLLDLLTLVGATAVGVAAILATAGPFPAWEGSRRRGALTVLLGTGLLWLTWGGRYWWSYPTLSYSSLPGPLSVVSLASLVWAVDGATEGVRHAAAAALALVAFLVVACRAPAGCVLWVLQLCVMVAGGRLLAGRDGRFLVRQAAVYVAASAVLFLPFHLAIAPQLMRVVESVAPAIRGSTHKSLLTFAPGSAWGFGVGTTLAFIWVAALVVVRRGWLVGVASVLGGVLGALGLARWGLVVVAVSVAAGAGAVAAVRQRGVERSGTLFWGVGVGCVVLACAVGSNGDVTYTATHLIPAMGAYCAVLAARLGDGRKGLVLLTVLLCVSVAVGTRGIVVKRFRSPYRTAGWGDLTEHSLWSPVLRGIRLSPDDAWNIDALIGALEARGFDKEQDRLVAYPDLPGLVAACGARAFGSAWVFTGFEGVDAYNLAWLESEPTEGIRHVYFVLADRLRPPLSDFAARTFRRLPGAKAERVGQTAWHRRDQFRYRLILDGPYVVEGAPRPAP